METGRAATDADHARRVSALGAGLAGGATLLDAHTEGVERVVLLIGGDDGARRELHMLLLDPRPCFWLEPALRRGRGEGSGFDDWLRRHVAGARIERVGAGASGRILRLDLGRPAEGQPSRSGGMEPSAQTDQEPDQEPEAEPGASAPAALVLDPLPNACRFLVLDSDERVIQRYPPTAHGEPRGRGAPGSRFAEPLRAEAPARGEGKSERELAADPVATSSVPVEDLFADAWNRAALLIRRARAGDCVRKVQRLLRAERDRLLRLQAKLAVELEEARGGTDQRRQAEALLANARRVPKGARSVTLEDPGDPGRKLTIELDPRLGFSENAKRLFRKAARLERSLPLREERAAHAGELLRSIEDWLVLPAFADTGRPGGCTAAQGDSAVDAEPGRAEVERALEEPIDSLQAAHREARERLRRLEPGLRRGWHAAVERWREALAGLDRPLDRPGFEARRMAVEKPVEPAAKPRRFMLPGGWEVLIGRSNRENDLLTHKVARPEDLWFHARGAAGSHVILRVPTRGARPSKQVIEQTASIAAYFSKARTSAMVPVVYTEKRYVRKPRKGTPGLAVCLREKVVMVKPEVPEAP